MGFLSSFTSSFPVVGDVLNYFGQKDAQSHADDAAEDQRWTQQHIADQNIAMQKEFAQNGLQWKVQDAVKAGLHPLAAIGAQTSGFSPVTVMPADSPRVPSFDFRMMGQDIDRAVNAMKSPVQKVVDATAAVQESRNRDLQNELLEAQINELNRRNPPGNPPGIPSNTVVTRDLDGAVRTLPSAQAALALMAAPWERWNWAIDNKYIPSLKELKYNLWTSQVSPKVRRFLAGSAEDYLK